MDGRILPFPVTASAKSRLAHFIRIGEAHRKLADLQASGRLPVKKVVVEASRLRHQKELIAAFRDDGAEIFLDTEVAELAALGKFAGHSSKAPWASAGQGRPLGPDHFRDEAASDVVGQVARCAVESQVDTVFAPTHYLGDPEFFDWLAVDRRASVLLRAALDREGGQHIALDYPVIVPHTLLNRDDFRGELVESIADLPVDTLEKVHESRDDETPRARPVGPRHHHHSTASVTKND